MVELPRYNGSSVYVVNETESLRVELQLKGSPDENSTVWTSSNSGMTPLAVGGRIEGLGNNFIAFSEVNRSDAGTYRVASSNCAGTGSFQFSIVINCKLTPLILVTLCNSLCSADPPEYTGESTYQAAEGSLDYRIELVLDSTPIPTTDSLSWLFNEQPLVDGEDGITFGVNFIQFRNLSRSNAGMYRIMSSNTAGRGEFTFQLTVNCK